jgi:hypothetical protein
LRTGGTVEGIGGRIVILSTEQVQKLKGDFIKLNGERESKASPIMDLIETIEALQTELFELKYGKYCRNYYIQQVLLYEAENAKLKDAIKDMRKLESEGEA